MNEMMTAEPETRPAPAPAPVPAPEASRVIRPLFTPEERAAFQTEDHHAGAMVVGIMTAIFATALIMYTFIAWIAWSG